MEDLRKQILNMQIRLATQDMSAQGTVCDEAFQLIDKLENEEVRNEIRAMIILHLVELNRTDDFNVCFDALIKSSDYHFHLHAMFAKAEYLKRKNDINGLLEAFQQGIQIAKENNDNTALAEGYLFRGKALLTNNKLHDSLSDFNLLLPIATEEKNYKLVAVAKYYIGLVLLSMNHQELAMEKIRESSEIAHEQKSSSIIMHTEVVRALCLLQNGKFSAATSILQSWYNEFKMQL